jgi:hypothetical protein
MKTYFYEVKVLRNAGNEIMHEMLYADRLTAERAATRMAQEWQVEPDPPFSILITPITMFPTKRPI